MLPIMFGSLLGIAAALLLASCDGDLNMSCRSDGSCKNTLRCDGNICRLPFEPIKGRTHLGVVLDDTSE